MFRKAMKKGFTLIEMLIVIAIIAVMVSIIVPTITNSSLKSNAAANAANLRTIEGQFATKYLQNRDTIVSSLYEGTGGIIVLQDGSSLEAPTAKECGAVTKGTEMWVMVDSDNNIAAYYNGYGIDYFAAIAETGEVDENYKADSRTELIQTIDQATTSLKNLVTKLDQYGLTGVANGVLSEISDYETMQDLLDAADKAADNAAAGTNDETATEVLEAIDAVTKNETICGTMIGHTYVDGKCSNCGKKEDSCVTPDTLVTLADGSKKRIDEVTYADELLVWDFYKGEFTSAPVFYISEHEETVNNVIKLTFADGAIVKVVNEHSFFNVDANAFISINAVNAQEYVGNNFVKANANGKWSAVELTEAVVTEETTNSYSLLTAGHYNAILEGMFSLTPTESGDALLTVFELGENLTYDAEQMAADIAEYGLYTYEDFAEYLSEEQFDALNIKYWTILVGKGIVTEELIMQPWSR